MDTTDSLWLWLLPISPLGFFTPVFTHQKWVSRDMERKGRVVYLMISSHLRNFVLYTNAKEFQCHQFPYWLFNASDLHSLICLFLHLINTWRVSCNNITYVKVCKKSHFTTSYCYIWILTPKININLHQFRICRLKISSARCRFFYGYTEIWCLLRISI